MQVVTGSNVNLASKQGLKFSSLLNRPVRSDVKMAHITPVGSGMNLLKSPVHTLN